MGIYASTTTTRPVYNPETGLTTWIEHQKWPGYTMSRTVTATEWQETDRTDCYCCSCGEGDGSDYLCRNHGYGFGARPCEHHNMPGSTILDPETDEDTGIMPDSVQMHLAKLQYRPNTV